MNNLHLRLAFTLMLLSILTATPAVADTIPVQAVQTAPRTVNVSWTDGYGTVTVSRLYPDQDLPSLIATTPLTSTVDRQHRAVCDDTVRYVVTNGVDSGFAAVLVTDNEPTAPPEWGVVTMDHTTGQIVLHWDPSPDTDIMGYLVFEGTPHLVIDTLFGRLNTTYAFPPEEETYVHQFCICAFDSCRKASPLTTLCNNIVVITENEPCSNTYQATWNSYFNMPSGIGSYELWVSQNEAPFRREAIVLPDDETSATFTVGEGCSLLRLYVKTVSADGASTALSNLLEIDIASALLPEKVYLRSVTVGEAQQTVTLTAETDAGWQGADYSIYRSTGGSTPQVVGHCRPSPTGQIEWHDPSARPDEAIYTYCVGVSDRCGRNEKRSQKGSTILPTLETNGGQTSLAWNPYEGWDGTTSYNVYIAGPQGAPWNFIGSTTATSLADVQGDIEGLRRYKVVACEGSDSRYALDDTAQSAVIAYRPRSEIWMPNAFTPLENSNNSVAPQASYISPDGYSFTVYNRDGLLVFSSTTPGEAWDGHRNGTLLPMGAYTYIITYRQNDGSRQQMKGTIMLIH